MFDELSPPDLNETDQIPRPNQLMVTEIPPNKITENSCAPPKVTVLLCVSDPRRISLCRTTINQFIRYQSYRNYELLVINNSGQAVTNREHALVREIAITSPESLATLRNIGIAAATGAWIMPIDDDDYHHAHRLALQMAHRQVGKCVMLSHQIRVDTKNSIVCIHEDSLGIPGSILFPRHASDYQHNLYDAAWREGSGEDVEFFERNFGDNRVVIPNDSSWFPGPAMMVCCWHGLNLKSREQFMGGYADVERYKGMRPDGLNDDLLAYLSSTLRVYGLNLGTDQMEGPAAAAGNTSLIQ